MVGRVTDVTLRKPGYLFFTALFSSSPCTVCSGMSDDEWMQLALDQARRGLGKTSPNPAVGAVIVKKGKLLSKGYHKKAGGPHAEIAALRNLAKKNAARGTTLFVTLEPCSTHGRTPPCCEAIIAAGCTRVVIGATDPNPKHAGRGVDILKKAGIEVTSGICADACQRLNAGWNHWIIARRPWVIAKYAMSLDGRLTRPPGESQWLTGEKAFRDVHLLRSRVDAILVGAETVRTDNPQLNVRGIRGAHQPWRIVLTRSGNLPKEAHLFTDEHKERTLVFRNQSLSAVLRELGKREITTVLIEGGGAVLGEALDKKLIHHVVAYSAPILCGGPLMALGGRGAKNSQESARILNPTYTRLGNDLRMEGDVAF